ncbi:TPA: pyridoxamine 5'-phosphate oxidase [Candidatus Poribacteria bacterium]|nr:pyridoxamine 5'-phosphate oxidase [Candidatus Poribacteria bacterium]HIA65392.1 pyridoxamine 5'-phosphate oxidase [Candidatus Poribacteria bacterium]HIB91470.1 pyridoxamine 5'-phosphate oxidase [Candidatus Poribacteria bacterium]HIB98280.1 pyridoxamine 5'-phosphate oxidase [Candidatus Poribacteria bacterium]HIN29431.1 pyridoxamine 5'-phosphate oxidase [Candidatus Poribacteria bacterium]
MGERIREKYARAGLDESDLAENPIIQFQAWLQQAKQEEIELPNAMTLATATTDGLPSARMVILREANNEGFVFYTDLTSQKSQEIALNPNVALVFDWRQLDRQVRVTGKVHQVSQAELEAYFYNRPISRQIVDLIAKQSQVVPNREFLKKTYQDLLVEYEGKELLVPPHWGGFRVYPNMIEFWQGRLNQISDRLRYNRKSIDSWCVERLSP